MDFLIKKQNKSILFLCTGNSARSQMAEVLLKHKAGDRFAVFSAGTLPEEVDPRAVEALNRFGLKADGLTSKHLDVYQDRPFDYVITLCNKATTECRSYPQAIKQLAWDFPDPKTRAQPHAFTTTINELSNRLDMFLLVEEVEVAPFVSADMTVADIDPIKFYKSLSDDIRLKTLMLVHYHGELCVCELMEAMAVDSQPKVSRNLAILKKNNIITDRKNGQWVFYRLNPDLPLWAKSVIAQTTENNIPLISNELQRLANMQNRPDKSRFCQ